MSDDPICVGWKKGGGIVLKFLKERYDVVWVGGVFPKVVIVDVIHWGAC
jgi:hypothetical protein